MPMLPTIRIWAAVTIPSPTSRSSRRSVRKRSWEDVRVNALLSEAQKKQSWEKPMQEHILLINEEKQYELVPYTQIPTQDDALRAFAFERNNRSYVVYWHASGEGTIQLPFPVSVQNELFSQAKTTDTLPVSHRRYASAALPLSALCDVFRTCILQSSEDECIG